jgi:hypothetical protein
LLNGAMNFDFQLSQSTGLKLVLPEAAHPQNSSSIQTIENCEENDAWAALEIELGSDVGQQSWLSCHRPTKTSA